MGRLVGACTLILGICLTALPAGAEKRVALVIGNSDYKLISRLANPANDATLMAETLRGVGFDVVEATNADRRGMARAIRDFGKRLRRAGPEAVGLFYYAGHGVQAVGTNYLIPLGAPVEDEADLEIEAVSASWVLGQMESAGNALNIVILDACRNNPFEGSFRAATRGLVRMNAPSGSLVAYAAAPGQVAADGTEDHSPYTAALVAAMREPGLALEQVFKRVRVAVEAATGEQQTPWEESSLKGDFYFVPQGSTVTVTPPGAPPAFDARAVELAFWNSIEKSADPADFEDFLARYPDGTFSGLAIRHLAALTKVAALPPPTPSFTVVEMDETLVVIKNANVRDKPSTAGKKVGRLSAESSVEVTGKLQDRNWFRIAYAGQVAYVFAPLLKAIDLDELTDWQKVKDSRQANAFEAFLKDHPDGYFAGRAKKLLVALTPPSKPSTASRTLQLAPPWFKVENQDCHVWNSDPQPEETATWSGACVDGKASGPGKMVWRVKKDGEWKTSSYEGDFKDGRQSGRGVYVLANGDRYEGDFKDGKKSGQGTFTWANGDRYEGEWRDNKQHGRGVSTGGGNRYEGDFKDGNFHGRGVLVFPDGDRYEGDFKDGNYHGRGVFVAANGKRYAGEWRDNFPQGSGTFYSGGDVYSGTWSNGCFQQGNRQAWVQATKSSCGF